MKLTALLCAASVALAQQQPPPEYGHGVPASCSTIPDDLALVNRTYVLPDPFRLLNGKRVKTIADWHCRAAQIRELFQVQHQPPSTPRTLPFQLTDNNSQKYELGYKPARPPILRSSYNGSVLEIQAGLSETQTINFSVPIKQPITPPTDTSQAAAAVIAYGGASVPIPSNIATITLDVGVIAQQNSPASRNIGLFYDLYGTSPNGNSTAGALMAWAWATSRIIDALEQHPEIGIDPTRLAVTGCSRNGKGALVAGAFDTRIALTIPQESGSGGDACWRTSRDMLVNQGLLTQTAQEIVGENVWFAESFDYFGRDNYTVGLLPVDHHELAGLVAPRGLYSTSNLDFLWLGGFSCWECMSAARRIYEALGVKSNHGFSQDGGHNHCTFPDDQRPEIQAFYDRFLLGRNVATDVFRTEGNFTFDPKWVRWSTPKLS